MKVFRPKSAWLKRGLLPKVCFRALAHMEGRHHGDLIAALQAAGFSRQRANLEAAILCALASRDGAKRRIK